MLAVKDLIIAGEQDNVECCRYFETNDGVYKFTVAAYDTPEPYIEMLLGPIEVTTFNPAKLAETLARRENEYYEDAAYEDWNDIRIMEEVLDAKSCRECPWIDECEAMKAEVEDE